MRLFDRPLRRGWIAASLLSAFVATNASAQTPYEITHSNGSYVPVAGGTTHAPVAYGAFGPLDEGSAAIPLPFTFIWYGQNYDTIHAYTNGVVSFSPPPATLAGQLRQPTSVPSTANLLHNFIGVMWHDLTATAQSTIRSVVTGSVGSRVVTIQYEDFTGFSLMGAVVNFQVSLFEGSNAVRIVMGPNSGIPGGNGGTTAIENSDGTDGINLMDASATCSAACACQPARCGSANWPTGHTIDIDLPLIPELTATITAPPGARVNTQFDVDVAVFNSGLSAAGVFQYRIYLTATDTSTAGGIQLGIFNVAGLPAASSIQRTHTLTVPPGTPNDAYFVAIKVDTTSVITEADEGNNTTFTGVFGTGPDLTGTILPPTDSGPGEPFPVAFSVRSDGAPVAGPIGVELYLSEMPVFDMLTAIPLGPTMLTLANGFTFNGSASVTMPLTVVPSPPNYYTIAILDPANTQIELDETNNILVSATTVDVRGPDLEGVSFDGGMFGFRGQGYPLSTTIRNTGGAQARDFTVCIYLSDNLLISTASDTKLFETGLLSLGAGDTQTLNLEPIIPAQTMPGQWYIATVVDCADGVPEVVETNNTERRADPIEVRDPSPDLVPVEIQASSQGAAGETTPIASTFGNIGNASGSALVRVVLSDNPGISTDDTLLYETPSPTTLDVSEQATISQWVAIPPETRSGTYYVGVIVDPDDRADETFEDNNVMASTPIIVTGADLAIVTPRAPNAIIGVPYARRFSAVGGAEAYTWTVNWANGNPPTGMTFDTTTVELTGTPDASAEGAHDFELTVTSGNLVARRTYQVIVSGPTVALTIVSSRLPPALAQERYSVQLVAVGGTPPYSWSLIDNPPFGLGLDSDGVLGGEPQIVAGSNFGVRVSDANGTSVDGTLSLDVVDPTASVSIQQADVPAGIANTPYQTEFTAAGGRSPYRWRLEGGPIPGLTFDERTALLTGTPTIAGAFPIVLEVRDQDSLVDRNAYVLEIAQEGTLRIVTGSDAEFALPEAILGENYLTEDGSSVRLRATPPDGVTWSIVSGTLPPGLELRGESGVITGAPSVAGAFAFVAFARNANNDTRRSALVLVVRDPSAPDPNMPEASGCGCTASEESGASWMVVLFLPLLWRWRRRTVLALTLVIVSGASVASAQSPYQVFTEVEAYVPLPPSATEVTPGLGDGGTATIQLPFDLVLYGEPYSTLYVNANGWVSAVTFTLGHHTPAMTSPDTTHPNGYIAPLWADWCASSNGCVGVTNPGIGIFYEIDSTPGAGRITIEWRRLRNFADDRTASDVNFQVTLYEGDLSLIEMHYGPMIPGVDRAGGPVRFNARIGIESRNGARGMFVGPCTGVTACTTTQIRALTNTKLSILADSGEDLTLSGVSAPSLGHAGLPLEVAVRLSSRHRNRIGPFSYDVYLLDEAATSTVGSTALTTTGPLFLDGFQSVSETAAVELPLALADGDYRVAVVIDEADDISEIDEDNNLAIGLGVVRVEGRAPDFRVDHLRPLTTTVRAGSGMDVAYTVTNFGNEPADLTMQLLLSENDAITTTDLAVGAPILATLARRQSVTATVSVTIPAGTQTGRYHLGVLLDPALTVAELDESNNVGRATDTVVVSSNEVAILTDSVPIGTLATPYEVRLEAAGGTGSFEWRLSSGTLPQGLAFDEQTGRLFGVPLGIGDFPLTFEVISGTTTAQRSLPLTVLPTDYPLTFITNILPAATLGADYAVPLRAVGGAAPYRYRIVEGRLPEGIVMAPDGVIFGVPRAAGFGVFRVELLDEGTATATRSLSLEVRSPGNLTITSGTLSPARLLEPYTQLLFASGGREPLRWKSITGLPPGLVIAEDGAVNGIPELIGDHRFAVEVTDDVGKIDTALIRVEVQTDDRLRIVTDSLPIAQPGQPYEATIETEGGETPIVCMVVRAEGNLPPGFEASQERDGEPVSELIIRGTAERSGAWPFSVRCDDVRNRTADEVYVLAAEDPPPDVEPIDDGGCGCDHTEGRAHPVLFGFLLLALVRLRRRTGER